MTTSASPPAIRTIEASRPLLWLRRGWADFVRRPWVGLLHGGLLAGFGLLMALVAHRQFWLVAGATSGFLLVAPLAATGLYAVSRALERGETADAGTALAAWTSLDGRLIRFGLLLALAGTGWVLTSAALITWASPVPIRAPGDFLRHVVAAREGWLFELWLMLGGFLAAPVFASSVVAIPLLLDRPQVGVLQAVLTSWRAVLTNPLALALWAAALMALTLLGLAPAMLGLLVVAPWLGHASWHAYRDLVP